MTEMDVVRQAVGDIWWAMGLWGGVGLSVGLLLLGVIVMGFREYLPGEGWGALLVGLGLAGFFACITAAGSHMDYLQLRLTAPAHWLDIQHVRELLETLEQGVPRG